MIAPPPGFAQGHPPPPSTDHEPDEVVIDLGPYLRARRVTADVDLAAAWGKRRVQLLEEAADLAREVMAAGTALSEASDRFRQLGLSALARLQQIDRQIEDIDVALAHLRRRDGDVD